jgi:hypothetical protein
MGSSEQHGDRQRDRKAADGGHHDALASGVHHESARPCADNARAPSNAVDAFARQPPRWWALHRDTGGLSQTALLDPPRNQCHLVREAPVRVRWDNTSPADHLTRWPSAHAPTVTRMCALGRRQPSRKAGRPRCIRSVAPGFLAPGTRRRRHLQLRLKLYALLAMTSRSLTAICR